MSLSLQIKDDLARAIMDWGVSITYRVVERVLDHETQQVSETLTDSICNGLVESEIQEPTAEVSGQGLDGAVRVVVAQDDLPADAPQLTDRILIDEEEYVITSFEQDSTTNLISLQIVRR